MNLILGFDSEYSGLKYSGEVIDVTLQSDEKILIYAQPLIHIDTDYIGEFNLYADVTYKGESQSLSVPVNTLTREDSWARWGKVVPSPYYHLFYNYQLRTASQQL